MKHTCIKDTTFHTKKYITNNNNNTNTTQYNNNSNKLCAFPYLCFVDQEVVRCDSDHLGESKGGQADLHSKLSKLEGIGKGLNHIMQTIFQL